MVCALNLTIELRVISRYHQGFVLQDILQNLPRIIKKLGFTVKQHYFWKPKQASFSLKNQLYILSSATMPLPNEM